MKFLKTVSTASLLATLVLSILSSCGRPGSPSVGNQISRRFDTGEHKKLSFFQLVNQKSLGEKLKLSPAPSHNIAGKYSGSTLVFRDSIYEKKNNRYLQTLLELSSDGRLLLNHEIGLYEKGAEHLWQWPVDFSRAEKTPEVYEFMMEGFERVSSFDPKDPSDMPDFLDLSSIKAKYDLALKEPFYQRWAVWAVGYLPDTYEDLLEQIQEKFKERIYKRLTLIKTKFVSDFSSMKTKGFLTSDVDADQRADQLMGLMELKREWMYDKPVAVMIVINRFLAEVFDDQGGSLKVRRIEGPSGGQNQYSIRLLSPDRFGWESKTRPGKFEIGIIEFCQDSVSLKLVACARENGSMPGPRLKFDKGTYEAGVEEGGPHIEALIQDPAVLGFKNMPRDLTKLIEPNPAAYFQEIPESELKGGRVSIDLTFSFLKPSLKIATLQFKLIPGPGAKLKKPYEGAVTLLQRLGGPSL